MEFSIVEGKRMNSSNYISDGYRYTKYRELNGTIYLRCTLFKNSACPGLAKICNNSNLLDITKPHNHSISEYKADSIVLSNKIKRVAEFTTDNLREVFNNECRSSAAGSTITFNQIESSMYKRRKMNFPSIPSTPEEFVELLLDSPFSTNHKLTIKCGNELAVVFATELMVAKLKEAETIHFDATFKVVPNIFYQLLTIFFQYNGHAIPAIHILMTRKDERLYTSVLSALHEHIPDFKPLFGICDYEQALRNSFRTIFPNITLVGCWFHYTKAVYDKVRKLGLGKLYMTSKVFRNWIHQLMSLPLLLEDEIQLTYLELHLPLTGFTELEIELINSFKRYFVKTWINGRQNLSVFYSDTMTNNGAESYHKNLKSYIKTNHPNVWKFVLSMDKVLADHDLELKRLENGLQITRMPKLKTRLNSDLRRQYKTKYLNKEYTPIEYINQISSTIGKENLNLQPISTGLTIADENSISELSSDEESISTRCHVCLGKRGENFALLHASLAHGGFCERCANTLLELKQKCPVCREEIIAITRIFQ